MLSVLVFFFFNKKTANEVPLSGWGSNGCPSVSSPPLGKVMLNRQGVPNPPPPPPYYSHSLENVMLDQQVLPDLIGRAPCTERA